MLFKKLFFYLSTDPYWLFKPILDILYTYKKKKLTEDYYKNNLNLLCEKFTNTLESNDDIHDRVKPNLETQYAPYKEDLSRLYNYIRNEKPFTVLEFGVGYSTLVIAKALSENEQEFNSNQKKSIRNSNMFKVFSVDASSKWIKNLSEKIPGELKKYIELSCSDVETRMFNGQVCHFYNKLPDINPEFIYLDGPHPLDPEGNINGISFKCIERTPIAADICLLESTMLPGCKILVDGRTNNVRFLKNNLKRNYKFEWDRLGDVTLITLNEKKLGKLNKLGFEYY